MLKTDNIKRNYFYSLLFQIINIIIPIITTPYLSRVLGVGKVGVYSFTYSFVSIFIMIASLGAGTYGQRTIASNIHDKEKISSSFVGIQTIKTISIILFMIIYIFVFCIEGENSIYFLIQIPYFIAAILDISWFYQGIEDFKFISLRNIMVKIICLILIFCLIKTPEDLSIYLLLLSLSMVFGNFVMWIKISKHIKKVKVEKHEILSHIRPMIVFFIPTIAYQIHMVSDKIMLGLMVEGTEENGYYEQAHKIINILITVVSSFNVVMRSRMTNLYSKGNEIEFKEKMNASICFVGFLIFPMALGLFSISRNFIPWFLGEEYTKVIKILMVFSPMFIFQGMRSCIGSSIITPCYLQKKANIAQCACSIVNIILNLFFINLLLSVGAAISSVVAEMILLIGYIIISKKYINLKSICKIIYKFFIAALIMTVFIFPLSYLLKSTIINTFLLILSIVIFF